MRGRCNAQIANFTEGHLYALKQASATLKQIEAPTYFRLVVERIRVCKSKGSAQKDVVGTAILLR